MRLYTTTKRTSNCTSTWRWHEPKPGRNYKNLVHISTSYLVSKDEVEVVRFRFESDRRSLTPIRRERADDDVHELVAFDEATIALNFSVFPKRDDRPRFFTLTRTEISRR